MNKRRVRCPGCTALLALPAEVRDCSVRCGRCRQVFHLPRKILVPEDTILGWLLIPDRHTHDDLADTLVPLASAPPSPAPGPSSTQRRAGKPMRLVSLGRRGAVFEFSASLLRSTTFRCSMPRVCVHCLARTRLSAHLVIYTPRLRDSISLEAEHRAGQLSTAQDQLVGYYGKDLLARLPEVPNVPPPANLPMPYWLCDLCSGAGEISGRIQVDPATGRGVCRLAIRNLQVAAAFFASVGAEGTGDYAKIREFLHRLREDRWDALPSVVRHRIEQWFRPGIKEHFLAYVPDRHFGRSEDGVAGVVLSDRRLVYHRPPLHQELPNPGPLGLEVRQAGDKSVVTIGGPAGKPRPITVDRRGITLLRRALSEGGFRSAWR